MTTKFHYGKRRFLKDFIRGEVSPRFSDISYYARLENEKMRDNEMKRDFRIDKSKNQITIGNHMIAPESIAEDPIISIPTQRCYCLCLTNRGNAQELYKEFQADICIEINIDMLIEILDKTFSSQMKIVVKQIKYFDPYSIPITTQPKELVFYKSQTFSYEAEFRIALFLPSNKRGFQGEDGSVIPFWSSNEPLTLKRATDKSFFNKCIVRVYEAPIFNGYNF